MNSQTRTAIFNGIKRQSGISFKIKSTLSKISRNFSSATPALSMKTNPVGHTHTHRNHPPKSQCNCHSCAIVRSTRTH